MNESINSQVYAELNELKNSGIKVSKKTFAMCHENLSEYENMNVSDIADLLRDLG